MREHVGVDVDSIDEDQLMSRGPVAPADNIETWDPDHEQDDEGKDARGITTVRKRPGRDRVLQTIHTAASSGMSLISSSVQSDTRQSPRVFPRM
jgi:phospholipase D1/2